MQLRSLGGSDLRVSPVGLGCWQFSMGAGIGGKYWPALPDDLIREIVRKSLEGGINWFDTAEMYGGGKSEEALAAALTSLGKSAGDVVIATKWWPLLRTAGSIPRTIGERRRRLNGFPIALYQVHQPFGFSTVEKEMDAMARLAEQGDIRYVGVSNFNEKRMRRAELRLRHHGLRLVSNQVSYSLLNRSIESNGVLDAAGELGVSIIAYSPLAQGVLSGKFHGQPQSKSRVAGIRRYLRNFTPGGLERTRPLVNLLTRVAAAHGASPAQVALAWVIRYKGDRIIAIPGATSPAQAEENAAAAGLSLTDGDVGSIDWESKRISA